MYIRLIIILAIILSSIMVIPIDGKVEAAGISTANISPAAGYSGSEGYKEVVPHTSWYNSCVGSTADLFSTTAWSAGWIQIDMAGHWAVRESIYGFDCSSIATDAEIKAVIIHIKQKINNMAGYPFDWTNSYFGWYKTIDTSGILTASDYSNAFTQGNIPLTPYKKASSYSTAAYTWYTYQLHPSFLNQIMGWKDGNGRVWFTFAPMRKQLNMQPSSYAAAAYEYITSDGFTAASIYLEIQYVQDTVVRELSYDANAAEEPLPTGNETASNVTWSSTRCAYADEALRFIVNGESGANVTLQLVDNNGTVLDNKDDSVRIDGRYVWEIPAGTMGTDYEGWIRVNEKNFALNSLWGRVEKSPSPTQQNLNVYAVNTEYPQYDNEFDDYVVYKDDLMYVHWKTNISNVEISAYGLELDVAGDRTIGNIFKKSLDYMNTDIYMCSNNNSHLAAWRYAIFSPQIISSGYDSRNGLIINLDKEYTSATSGFLCPMIYKITGDTILTETHSCYFYLYDATQGVSQVIEPGLIAKVNIGVPSKVWSNLSSLEIIEMTDTGAVISTIQGSSTSGEQKYTLTPIGTAGNYQLRFIFSDNVNCPYYSYIHDVHFTMSKTGDVTETDDEGGVSVKGWQSWLKNMLKRYGMDNTAGHWLIIFGLCITLAIVFRKTPAVATVLVLLVFAGGWALKWLDTWFIALMSIGAGLAIYSFFRKKEKGNTGDEA